MTAPGTHGAKTADELVEALLDSDEYRAVLRYTRDHGLEKDDTVLFMVGMLKVFAYVWDRLGEMMRILNLRAASMQDESLLVEQRFADTAGEHIKVMHKVLNEHVKLIGHSAAQINFAAGEMKVLYEQMTLITRDAERTLAVYDAIKGETDTKSMTTLIDERLTAALTKRVSVVDEIFQERMLGAIYRGMDQFILRTRFHTVLIIAIAAIVIFLVRR